MTLSAAQKARLKRQYLEGAVPYAALVAESGLQRFEFQSLVKSENWGGWQRAVKAAKASAPRKGASDATGATAKRKLTPKPTGLLKLVYGTIEKELGKLERQSGDKSQDRERASRALSQIMNSLEKAVEMQREIAKDETRGGDKKEKEALRNAEDLRKEIVERIERFRAARAVGK